MITKEQAIKLKGHEEIHCETVRECKRIVGPRGGITDKIVRVRISGRCKTWKRDPERFHLPVKFGMYESYYIDQDNAACFHLAADCPIKQAEQLEIDKRLAAELQATADKVSRANVKHSLAGNPVRSYGPDETIVETNIGL